MKNVPVHLPITRLFRICLFLFSLCLAPSVNLFAACTCPAVPPTCIPQPCTGCTCCEIQPNNGCADPPGTTHLLRKTVPGVHGAITFIGNALGLNKISCNAALPDGVSANNPGTMVGNRAHSQGAFITTDASDVVNNYISATTDLGSPGGTTLDYTKSNSNAILNLPAGSTVLYAELVWSGGYGIYCDVDGFFVGPALDPDCILIPASTQPVRLTTPDNVTHMIMPDPATAMRSQTLAATPFCLGFYVRSQDVTKYISPLANPNGTYAVGGVPASISAFSNMTNASGWT